MDAKGHARAARRALITTILGFLAATVARESAAGTIKVTTTGGVIHFKDAPANSAYKIYNHSPNDNKGTVISGGTGTTDASGESGSPIISGMNGTFEVEVGGEHYLGIDKAENGTNYKSLEQINKSVSNFSHGLSPVFAASFSSVFTVNGVTTDQFNLFNASAAFPYDFTMLVVYKGLDKTYFTAAAFDSTAAIASGTFYRDLVATTGGLGIPVAGGQDIPMISIPVSGVSGSGYDLVIGTAQPYLGNGMFGSPFAFSLASSPFPEPDTWSLMLIGSWGLGATLRCRRKTAPVSTR